MHPNHSADPTAAERKKDHIELAFKSRIAAEGLDPRFYYEPLLAPHPTSGSLPPVSFLGKTLRLPIWVSSMTGGTAMARIINHNLAKACGAFGMGMGLGSCRQLLYSDEYLPDFDVRDLMGSEVPLFANLGVAQIEQLMENQELERIPILLKKLRADGLIIHVNPLQEALQPEGDVFRLSPLEVIKTVLNTFDALIIVKEVGQGMGPESCGHYWDFLWQPLNLPPPEAQILPSWSCCAAKRPGKILLPIWLPLAILLWK